VATGRAYSSALGDRKSQVDPLPRGSRSERVGLGCRGGAGRGARGRRDPAGLAPGVHGAGTSTAAGSL